MQPRKHGSAGTAMDWTMDDEMGNGLWAFMATWANGGGLNTNFVEEGGKGDVAGDELGDKACVFARKRGEGTLVG